MLFAGSNDELESVMAVLGQKVKLICYSPAVAVKWTRNDNDLLFSGIFRQPYALRFALEVHRGQQNLIIYNSSLSDAGKYVCSGVDDGAIIKQLNLTIVEGNHEHILYASD